jgi:hypothetical protein
MDSQKKDESRDRRREEALARRMGEALDRLESRDSNECPDAEMIAAYHERALQPDEIAQWESHFAECSRCRKILLVLAASVDAPLAEKEVAHLGQRVRTLLGARGESVAVAAAHPPRAASPRTAEPARPNRLDWRVRWLAPAFGVAAALAVWFAMRPPWRTTDQNPSGTLVAQVAKNEPPQNAELKDSERFSKVAPQKKSEADALTRKDEAVSRVPSTNPAPESLLRNRAAGSNAIGGIAPSSSLTADALQNLRKEKNESKGGFAGTPGPPSPRVAPSTPAPAPPQAQAQLAEPRRSVTEVPGSAAQTVVVTGEAAEVTTRPSAKPAAPAGDKQAVVEQAETARETGARAAANLPVAGRDFKALSKLDSTAESAALIRTTSGSTSWRVGKGGRIERSADAGRTWILQASPLQEDWLAGTATSDTICWIVGRNGAIARTTDGERWEKIVPPPLAADLSGKLPDWITITTAGAQIATITASDQRRYATQDGGKSWRVQ